jgi:uncharacterized protein YcbK (DUF882 family)
MKKKHQVKSRIYYLFWGIATASVLAGQIYVGTGYRQMAANQALYRARLNLPAAAKHCGMTEKEMKMTFLEYLKYHPIDYESTENTP